MRATRFYRDSCPELRAVPGVTSAAAVSGLPTQFVSNGGYWIEGGPTFDQLGVARPAGAVHAVVAGVFQDDGHPAQARAATSLTATGGRADGGDRQRSAGAGQSFPNEDPIGRRIQCGLDTPDFMTIVGVVGDVRTWGPQRPAQARSSCRTNSTRAGTSLTLIARTETADPLTLKETIGAWRRERNPDVPVQASTMDQTLQKANATPRFQTFLLVVFAGVALMLALAGVYGVMAYTVSQRVPELGVRVALGATPGHIRALVFGQAAKLAGAGLVSASRWRWPRAASSRASSSVSLRPTPRPGQRRRHRRGRDARGLLHPGRRAVRVDPMVALRAE